METCLLLPGALFRLTQARLGDVIPTHGHGVIPEGGGVPGGGRSVGRRLVSAHGRGELAHGSVHHPSERLHRHVFSPGKTRSGVRVVTATAHAHTASCVERRMFGGR